jgi:hypothetical protein
LKNFYAAIFYGNEEQGTIKNVYRQLHFFFSDFVRSVVLEGCEVTTFQHPDNFLSLAETSDLGSIRSGRGVHLTGGASLYPFVGYFVKNIVANPDVLPVKYFCVGRQYRTQSGDEPVTLLQPQQSTAVQCFSANSSLESMQGQLVNLVDVLKEFYDGLGLHYRIGQFLFESF